MSYSICFVTPQIYPGTVGGIGRLISTNALALYKAGWSIVFLLDISPEALQAFRDHLNQTMPQAVAYHPNELLVNLTSSQVISPKTFRSEGHYRAYRLALALGELAQIISLDGVELVDYLGHGYVIAQWRKLIGLPLNNISMWVRLHGTSELCQQAESEADLSFDSQLHFLMERYLLTNVDALLGPSPTLSVWYQTYYQVDCSQFYHTPPFEQLGPGNCHPRTIEPDNLRILFYGKVQALKGADTFVKAALRLCQELPQRIDFELVGGEDEGLVTRFGSYQEKLLAFIPPEYKDRFHFRGPIKPADLPSLAQRCTLAVIPSKFETFCLAAHELNWIGIPLILNDIHAFGDYFNSGQNCLKFDGTVDHLVEVIKQLLVSTEPFAGWRWTADTLDTDPISTYEAILTTLPRQRRVSASKKRRTTSIIIWHQEILEKLQRCLDSLAANTHQPDQIIVICSEDKPVNQLGDGLAELDVKLVNDVASAMQQVRGDYILPLTTQQWLHPKFLQYTTAALEREPAAGVVTTYRRSHILVDGSAACQAISPYEAALPLLLYENLFLRTGSLFKRSVFEQFGGQKDALARNDWDFWLDLVAAGIPLEVVPLILLDEEARPASTDTNQMGQALVASQVMARHPRLIQKYALELLSMHTFAAQNKDREFNHEREVFAAVRREWEHRFNSQDIIIRRFVQLTRLNILKAIRNPSGAWPKLQRWWRRKSSQATE